MVLHVFLFNFFHLFSASYSSSMPFFNRPGDPETSLSEVIEGAEEEENDPERDSQAEAF